MMEFLRLLQLPPKVIKTVTIPTQLYTQDIVTALKCRKEDKEVSIHTVLLHVDRIFCVI